MAGLIDRLARGRPDNFQTPDWPLELLYRRISQQGGANFRNWDPFSGKGNIVKFFNSKTPDLEHLGTDLETGTDFLNTEKNCFNFDMIVSNPPYSIKDACIAKCYEHGKPFALLMPLAALEGRKRQKLYMLHGLSLLLLPRRVNFQTPSGKGSGSHFATAWFTHGFGFKPMEFLQE
jgi:hypothetical protein